MFAATAMLTVACAPQRYEPAGLDHGAVVATLAETDLPAVANAVLAELGGRSPTPAARWNCATLGPVAAARSHAVQAALADGRAAGAARGVAALHPAPGIGLTLQYDDEKDPGDDSHYTIGPTFQFLWSPVDRGRIRAALADAETIAARARLLEAAWQARDGACRAALEFAAARRAGHALEHRAALLDAALRQAEAAVAAGLVDGLTWQALKLERHGEQLARLDQVRAQLAAGAALAAALGLAPAALGGFEYDVAPDLALPPYDELQRHALMHHPRVLEALAAYDKSEHDLELEVAAQYPDIRLSPSYLFDQGDNVWSLVSGIVIPLSAQHDVRIAAAAARRDAARSHFERLQAEVITALRTAHAQWAAVQQLTAAASTGAKAMARERAALEQALAAGVGDALLVARARLQEAQAAARIEQLALDAARARLALERTAALPHDDALFATQLVRLYNAVPVAADAP